MRSRRWSSSTATSTGSTGGTSGGGSRGCGGGTKPPSRCVRWLGARRPAAAVACLAALPPVGLTPSRRRTNACGGAAGRTAKRVGRPTPTAADARRARSADRALRGGTGVHLRVLLERWIQGNESSFPGRTPWWRWRESNPRPTTHHQGFSERSPLCLCSTPSISRTSRCDGPSRCLVSRARPRPARTVSHLADARHRADDEPGLTELPTLLSGSEGELALTGVGACVGCNAWLTSSSLPSSARFPWPNDRSRDHSPPV